jgi:hypothetical protein
LQSVETLFAAAFVKEFSGQCVHMIPFSAANERGLQVHEVFRMLPDGESVFNGQLEQRAIPVLGLYLPAPQNIHGSPSN